MNFGKVFAIRSAVCFFVICFMLLVCCLRLYSIATSDYSAAQSAQSSLVLQMSQTRGTIYDRNMMPLNNQHRKILAAVSPTPRAVVAISSALYGSEELDGILERLSSGKPVICEVPQAIECEGIVCRQVTIIHDSDQPAEHIIGYIDKAGHGVTGLEKAYDDILFSDSKMKAVFKTDGMGRVLEGEEIEIEGEFSAAGNGVVTTLDVNIQSLAEQAALEIEKGAVVISDIKSGEIRAMVSRPSFDCTRISDFLGRSDAPLLNRSLEAYNVGSVFKPCVAAAGLETGKRGIVYECTGSTKIIDRDFGCHYRAGHGAVNLFDALAQSCNVYFYRYSLLVGREGVYNTAKGFGFGNKINIAKNISTSEGSITEMEELKNPAALANLSIGQGRLALSPVAMLNLYTAIANGGYYYNPTLVTATLEDGKRIDAVKGAPTRAMSQSTANTVRDALVGVIEKGTGLTAAPTLCTAAGKTATAQTGVYNENGQEITNGWFCGFFPAREPKYAVVIMEENTKGGDVSPIFSKIADGITELEG